MKKFTFVCLSVACVAALLVVEPAFAGPGGKIASAVFESFWGKVVLGLLVIIFAPLIIYTLVKEKIAERRARRDLRFMAAYDAQFDWLAVQERVKDCFFRVHSGWEDENLAGVSDWMTSWYWQNQQSVHLNRWKKEGLINICNVKKIVGLKPLLFVHRNQGQEHENSMLVVSITARMQDYLKERASSRIVEGSKRFKEVETVWSFTFEQGSWKVSDIEDGSRSLDYANMVTELPAIESTVVSDLRA
ncbi:MAG: Tim44 domain-containing protein [Hahellaceae bacterium]|nr:Tim44 domain-containing protein [Hahellaceae bacterium]MCP5169726.1 Tim44 domain-containing protein [Hahellaceae bacterium]